jgi:triacylglycerol lipase
MDRQHLLLLLSVLAVGATIFVLLRLQRGRSRVLAASSPSSPLSAPSPAVLAVQLSSSEPVGQSGAIVLQGQCALEPATGLTRYPLVLVHGMFGFEAVRVGGQQHQYFRGIRARLEQLGNRVHVVRLPVAAGIRTRAAELARQVQSLGVGRVNLVAHSMGGIDARYAISKLGLQATVASLTTIGTPHWGTPVAHGSALLFDQRLPLGRLLAGLGADLDGLRELTPARMFEFNRDVPDVHGVLYASYVGIADARKLKFSAPLWPSLLLLSAGVGPSDGLVPAVSQRWGSSSTRSRPITGLRSAGRTGSTPWLSTSEWRWISPSEVIEPP